MPEIRLSRVVSVTSEDPRHPAENLLQPDAGGRWKAAAAGEKQISVLLELPGPQQIHGLHVGNEGSAFVEALVGNDPGGDFQVLLPSAAFMTPLQSRAGEGPRGVRIFGPRALAAGAAGRGWRLLRLVCSQPYCQTRPFGLSFVRVFSPPEDEEDAAAASAPPPQRLGPFTLRGAESPRRPPGSLFYRRDPSPTPPPPKDPPGPSYAVATLQASASPSPKARRRPSPPKNGAPPPPVLGGVVLALSGFQHPERGRLRAAATAMGAAYRPHWTPDSTHLVAAFPRTPKAAQARAGGGVVVGPEWIWDCQRQRRRLPIGPYLLDADASSGSDGEGPAEAPPPPPPNPSPPKPQSSPSPTPAPPPPPTPPQSDGDAASASDQSEEDPYGGSTEENSEEEPIPPLPDFFEDKTFFFHGDFPAGEGRRLLRYVTAFGGTLSPYMSDAVTHVVTSQDWDPTFQEALELRPSLTFVRPRWLLLCGEKQRPLPAAPYALRPPRDVIDGL